MIVGIIVTVLALAAIALWIFDVTRPQSAPEFVLLQGQVDVRQGYGPFTGTTNSEPPPDKRMQLDKGDIEQALYAAYDVLFKSPQYGNDPKPLLNFTLELRSPNDPYMLDMWMNAVTQIYRPTTFSVQKIRVIVRMLERQPTAEEILQLRNQGLLTGEWKVCKPMGETALFHEIAWHVVPAHSGQGLNEQHSLVCQELQDKFKEAWQVRMTTPALPEKEEVK